MINNNGGGGIFDTLPGLNNSETLTDYITVKHNTSAKSWAEQQGFKYLSAKNEDELRYNLPAFLSTDNTAPIVIEVFTSIEKNSKEINSFYQQQRK
jgi:2-succinyl-5-enolpyruvyl-6-hydroxy-3-cyclohexene-1-carboxylate synthase